MDHIFSAKPDGSERPADGGPVWLSAGFRPFFLGAVLSALGLMVVWLLSLSGGAGPSAYYGAFGWHAHEMLFGFGVAVITGFLLTAVVHWTGRPTLTGVPLLLLFLLWLAGRLVALIDGVPGLVVAAVDMSFLPVLIAVLAGPLLTGGGFPKPFVLPLLLVLTVANGLIHLELTGVTSATFGPGLALTVGTVVLMIAFIAGWAIPMFTSRALAAPDISPNPALERISMGVLATWVVAETVGLPPAWLAPLALLAAGLHAVRLRRWSRPGVARVALLWVLFAGYGWLVAGLLLKGLSHWGWIPPSAATHAFTAGAVGVMSCGTMARVSLGNTGRRMVAGRAVAAVFALINLAAVVRVAGALLPPDRWLVAMTLAGGVWIAGFGVLLWYFIPVWLGLEPRVD